MYLVKVIVIVAMCCYCASDAFAEDAVVSDEPFSPFDVTEDVATPAEDEPLFGGSDDAFESGGAALLAPKFSSQFVDTKFAKINIIDVSFGRSHIVDVGLDSSVPFGEVLMSITRCVKEIDPSLGPVHKAHITISEHETQAIIFNGWIFSGYRSLAQPVYGNYFFTLRSCVDGK